MHCKTVTVMKIKSRLKMCEKKNTKGTCEQNTCSFIRTTVMSLSDVKYEADTSCMLWVYQYQI